MFKQSTGLNISCYLLFGVILHCGLDTMVCTLLLLLENLQVLTYDLEELWYKEEKIQEDT